MTASEGTVRKQDLTITERPKRPDLVVPVLMRHLGLSWAEAMQRLESPALTLASDLSPAQLRHLQSILSALGVRTRPGSAACAHAVDLSLQLAVWAKAAEVASRLAAKIGHPVTEVLDALCRPGGMVLPALPDKDAQALLDRLRPIRGLLVTPSDPRTAVHDLYATRPLTVAELARLATARSLIGAMPDPLTEAVAAGLDGASRNLLVSRLADLDLLPLDRRFQRFDLVLTGASGWSRTDLADFLTSRTHLPRAAIEALSPEAPVTLDLGLGWSTARQFCGDYGAIGLFVRPVLSRRGRNA